MMKLLVTLHLILLKQQSSIIERLKALQWRYSHGLEIMYYRQPLMSEYHFFFSTNVTPSYADWVLARRTSRRPSIDGCSVMEFVRLSFQSGLRFDSDPREARARPGAGRKGPWLQRMTQMVEKCNYCGCVLTGHQLKNSTMISLVLTFRIENLRGINRHTVNRWATRRRDQMPVCIRWCTPWRR